MRVGYTVHSLAQNRLENQKRLSQGLLFLLLCFGSFLRFAGTLACCTVVSNVIELSQAHGAGYEWIRGVDAQEEEAVCGQELECQAMRL